ncbi:hypothetical protein Q9314_13665 [Shinella sumterensis]|nr:hypothetical protein Q9314_13665 [Shinella sumterensis]
MAHNQTENLFDGLVEILPPHRCGKAVPKAATCICCGRADQAIDDDGCGICDACIGAPAGPGVSPLTTADITRSDLSLGEKTTRSG